MKNTLTPQGQRATIDLAQGFEWQVGAACWRCRVPFTFENIKGETMHYSFELVAGSNRFCTPQKQLSDPTKYSEVELFLVDEHGEQTSDFEVFLALGDAYVCDATRKDLVYVAISDICQFLASCQ